MVKFLKETHIFPAFVVVVQYNSAQEATQFDDLGAETAAYGVVKWWLIFTLRQFFENGVIFWKSHMKLKFWIASSDEIR